MSARRHPPSRVGACVTRARLETANRNIAATCMRCMAGFLACWGLYGRNSAAETSAATSTRRKANRKNLSAGSAEELASLVKGFYDDGPRSPCWDARTATRSRRRSASEMTQSISPLPLASWRAAKHQQAVGCLLTRAALGGDCTTLPRGLAGAGARPWHPWRVVRGKQPHPDWQYNPGLVAPQLKHAQPGSPAG